MFLKKSICLLLLFSVPVLSSVTNITNKINTFRLRSLRNDKIKKLLFSEKYKMFRSKMKKTKNKIKSVYYESLHQYYSLSEEERTLIDTIADMLY